MSFLSEFSNCYVHIFECTHKKGGVAIKIIVYYPETQEKQTMFDECMAKFHAEYVAQYIEKLNCSLNQKLKLIDAVAQTILKGSEKNA